MKRYPFFLGLFLVLVLVLTTAYSMASDKASGEVQVFVNGKRILSEVQPEVAQGTILVPLRDVSEALGAEVVWEENLGAVTITRDNHEIRVVVGQKTALRNGAEVILDVAPVVRGGKVMIPLRFIAESLGESVEWDEATRSVYVGQQSEALPSIGSYENLKSLLASAQTRNYLLEDGITLFGAGAQAPMAAPGVGAAEKSMSVNDSASPTAGHSDTNVQVEGVDEADIVKTDGEYIYQVNNQRVVVARAYPAGDMRIMSMLQFEGQSFTPQEMYVDQDYLVVIGSSNSQVPLCRPGNPAVPQIYPPPPYSVNTCKAIVYDIADKSSLKQLREVELEGDYVSSRKIGSALYLVANKGIYYHILEQTTQNVTPSYRDSAGQSGFVNLDYPNIRYFPGCVEPNYLLVAGLNLDRPGEEMKVSSFLGGGQNVYASRQNLYVAMASYESTPTAPVSDAMVAPKLAPRRATQPGTAVYKFALDDGRVNYLSRGEVPGTVLNQFSMDEHNGYFRVATTGSSWDQEDNIWKNNVYILDGGLGLAGKLEDIAPGERIYSVRFMGDRGYMVTFKTVDPLFVIDLKDPRQPGILGALKIPGYSDYLHPYDDTHIIGFGKDTVEISQKDLTGAETGTMAFYQGMKMAIFDVSDVGNPVEEFREIIGDRGTDSELLRNHKALLFDREKGLLAFPVTVMKIADQGAAGTGGIPQYGQFDFQGAYVYHVDLVDGFSLRTRITHLSQEDYLKAGSYWYYSDYDVNRIIYIGDTLYTLSRKMIKAHDLASLSETASLAIP